jgi:hypothetical protein
MVSYLTAAALNNALFVGDNVIAVEVHQNATGSSDIVHGLSLTAIVPTALSITSQPPSQLSTTVGQSVVLNFGVAGGPALYQWQTNNGSGTFININTALARANSYTFAPTAAGTRIFRCVASNGVNTVISSTCTVTVDIDNSGPLMLSAVVLEEANRTNRIQIVWNEGLSLSLANRSATNYTVILSPSNIVVGISNVILNNGTFPNPALPPITILQMNSTNWHIGTNYYVKVSHLRDLQNNVIAPNSVIGVGWPTNVNTNVLDFNAAWEYHIDWGNPFNPDPTIYQQPWYALDYDTATNGHWGSGVIGVVYKDTLIDPGTYVPCRGTLGSELGSYVRNPTLFRSSFVVPTNLATNVTLRITHVVDDGYVLYLNGEEIRRQNVAGTAPVDETTRTTTEAPDGQCASNNVLVTLLPGTNVVAAAVCQWTMEGLNGGDTYWGLRLDVTKTSYRVSPVPANGTSPVRLAYARPSYRSVMFTWPTNIYGYTLEFTTNITRVGQNTVLGPWYQAQTNLAIGMVTNYPVPASGSGPAYIFRLHKVP